MLTDRLMAEMWPLLDGPPGKLREQLLCQRVPGRVVRFPPGPVVVGSIHTGKDGLFEWADPEDGGRPAYVVPVWAPPVEHRTMIDLAAWAPGDPARVFRRTGDGVWLGEAAVWQAEWDERPLRLWRTPLRWFQANCDGAVILDAKSARFDLLRLASMVAEDGGHAQWLDRLMRGPQPTIPKIKLERAA